MRNTITLALLSVASFSQGQECSWLTSAPIDYEMNPAMANEVLAAAPGRLVAGRQITGTFNYGQTVYGRAVVEALDPGTGVTNWSCMMDDTVSLDAAVVGADGKAYFAGRFMGAMQLCNGEVVGGVPGQGLWNENLFLLAVDLNTGLVEWVRNISMQHDQASKVASMAIDPEGRLWYAVSEWGVGKAIRVDEDGVDQETRVVDGVRVLGTISFDPWGGLYVSGSCDNFGFAFGGQAFTDPGETGYSMFVLRYKLDGTAGFVKFAEDGTFHDPTVVATNDGHAYLAGSLISASAWDGFELHGPNWGGDVFMAKLDSSGDFQWVHESSPVAGSTIVGDVDRASGPCIAIDDANNLFFMGDLRGSVDWGNGVVSQVGAPTDHGQTIVAFDPNGVPQWASSSNAVVNFANARTITASAASGVLHFASHVRDTFTFSPLSTNNAGDQAAAFGQLSGISTSVPRTTGSDMGEAWPVPSRSVVYVRHKGANTTAALLKASGEQVRTLRLVPGRNTVDMSYLPAGLYFLRTAEGEVMRLVKE